MNMQRSQKTAIAILISGNGSNLQALMDAVNPGLSVDIKVVISNKADAYGLIRARDEGIATEVIEHDDYTSRAAFDEALASKLDTYCVDWILLAGFMRRLDTSFVQRYSGRIINIHPSLLPKYKGLHTHEAVLAAGDAEHGASIHFVTEEVDGGPVICQARFGPIIGVVFYRGASGSLCWSSKQRSQGRNSKISWEKAEKR